MSWQSNSSSSNHAGLSRFLIVLGIVAVVVVVGYSISVLSDKSGGNSKKIDSIENSEKAADSVGIPESGSTGEEEPLEESASNKDPEGRTILTGIASEVFSRKDNPELKWVTLSVVKEDGSFADYKFVFDKDTKGDARLVLGGERITVFFFGEPSNEDAVVVGEVRNMRGE